MVLIKQKKETRFEFPFCKAAFGYYSLVVFVLSLQHWAFSPFLQQASVFSHFFSVFLGAGIADFLSVEVNAAPATKATNAMANNSFFIANQCLVYNE
jgi:hypothetical protein